MRKPTIMKQKEKNNRVAIKKTKKNEFKMKSIFKLRHQKMKQNPVENGKRLKKIFVESKEK